MSMRNLIIILAVVIFAVAIIPEVSDADRPANEPTEPVVLCYYTDGAPNIVTAYYVRPNEAIGSANIPEPTGAIHYWIRMDTGEVVTASSTFAPGTYMIKGYTTAPTPWGAEEPSGSRGLNEAEILAIILLSSEVVMAAAFIWYVIKK